MADFPPPPLHKDFLSFIETILHSPPPPKDLHPSSASFCEDDPPIIGHIQDKIENAFKNLQGEGLFWLIQFWAPLKIAGRRILTTSDQPFLLPDEDDIELLKNYRSCCVKYKYNIEVDKVEVEDDPTNTIISSGTPATAFLNRMPGYLLERVDLMSPLESSAFECELSCSVVLPVFYPSQGCCVGVVECSTSSPDCLLPAFNVLNFELEKAGVKTFDPREHLPYKTICSLQHAKDEIDEALKIICRTLPLPLAQKLQMTLTFLCLH
ncbi:hypothetical protein L6452_25371 [Arctium lappa]|uniref:Uncharacterized protein n=1 Tax=Arctium lappa TaxID=4217 RepID=A0ACB9ABA2_ARCLA|nr:hypothetical protein L6452_25371 [Arctium lappa]